MAFGRSPKAVLEIDEKTNSCTRQASAETFIDSGSLLSGELHFAGNVRFEGRVEGHIHAEKTVIVGEGAEIDASITAQKLEVHGTVAGEIRVLAQTTLHKTARVEAEIQTAGIVIEEGARFKGAIVIEPEEYAVVREAPNLKSSPDDPQADSKPDPAPIAKME